MCCVLLEVENTQEDLTSPSPLFLSFIGPDSICFISLQHITLLFFWGVLELLSLSAFELLYLTVGNEHQNMTDFVYAMHCSPRKKK